jgi:hypothetical protein
MARDIFDRFNSRDIAIAVASSNRIMMDIIIGAGVDGSLIEKSYRAKAQQLLTEQFEEGAGELLMLMSGTVKRSQAEE